MTENEFDIEEPDASIDTGLDMGEPAVDPKSIDVSPDAVVEAIQRKRMALLLNNSPLDKDELSLMNDLGKTAQTQQRISVENKVAESDAELSKQLAAMVTSGISIRQENNTEKDITPPSIDSSELDKFSISEELTTTHQEEISIDEIMSAPDLKVDN